MEQIEIFGILLAQPEKPLIFLSQFILSLFVFAVIVRKFAGPWLASLNIRTALILLILPHTFRHAGLSFLVPGLVTDAMPPSFAMTAAYGDFVAGLLAIVAIFALQGRWKITVPALWLFSIVGVLDLANALRQTEAVMAFRSTWFIPTFLVPLLLTTHAMVIARLWARPTLSVNTSTKN